MKKTLLLLSAASLFVFGCSQNEDGASPILNTENSIIITGINESISYTFTSNSGRTESSVPDDINMIQILILDESNQVVYEQYHYNSNA